MTLSFSLVCEMSDDDFFNLMLGKPYVDRACSVDAVDCWGLVVLYYRMVHGINIHHSNEYSSGGSFITCFSDEVLFWEHNASPVIGGIFVSYYGSMPRHVGIVAGRDKILHAREKTAVRFDRIETLKKLSTKVEWLTYAGDSRTDNARPSPING